MGIENQKFFLQYLLCEIQNINCIYTNETPESRKDWMLYRFEFAGKFDNRGKKNKFWQDTNHAVSLNTSEMIDPRINYTHENPVRALIVAQPNEYLFSSTCDYSGETGFVQVQTEI